MLSRVCAGGTAGRGPESMEAQFAEECADECNAASNSSFSPLSGDGAARPRIAGSHFQSKSPFAVPFPRLFLALATFCAQRSAHTECDIEIIIHVENTFRSVLSSLNVQIQLAEYGQLKPGRFLVIVAGHDLLNFAATAQAAGDWCPSHGWYPVGHDNWTALTCLDVPSSQSKCGGSQGAQCRTGP